MEYNFTEVEKKWQKYWAENKTFRAENASAKPKYYVLDMFPYPSGAGLHVGHPLGYIASDIYARFKRLKGFNVLHPMGYDSFGLPAEQYAIQTGQHPNITTKNNIARYREQLDKIGFSFDWEREVRTSDPEYYKWTQWIFIKLFNSWYNPETNKAESIDTLIPRLKKFSSLSEKEKSYELMNYRLAYLSETYVNWCPQLGTVLANEEVKDGVSERGGYPVERKLMPQWSLRITAYADRLLNDLEKIDWSESIKEAQRNWIGKSEGSSLQFTIHDSRLTIEVFTTRPDTVFGVSFLTLAPEHELIEKITSPDYKQKVEEYITYAKNRSERERMTDVKKITGQFTGTYALHPFSGKQIPIWIGEYVLAGYGTGAVMGVPGHDERDYSFAKHFELPILEVVTGGDLSKESYDAKEGKLVNSDFLNGLEVKDAIKKAIAEIEKKNLGKGKTNYRLRDAIFGRQRYWGEPIPIYYKDSIPCTLDESELPLVLPEVNKYLPTESGEPPLARAASSWKYKGEFEYEKTTMPGWAGSSWYYLRYMDAHNKKEFASKDAVNYWKEVDLYIGGSEHATGHLLYVRFWTKFLNDLGYISITEPAKKLINQGMIQGVSLFAFQFINFPPNQEEDEELTKIRKALDVEGIFESKGRLTVVTPFDSKTNILVNEVRLPYEIIPTEGDKFYIDAETVVKIRNTYSHLDDLVLANRTFMESFCKKYSTVLGDVDFEKMNFTKIYLRPEVEKMSKSKWNVVTPDDIIEKNGADCLRMYEMFLGPLEQSKPWNTNGIAGVSNFIRKLWRLYHANEGFTVSDAEPTKDELKILHKTIKKVQEDIEKFSFNTSVSSFMICVNELTDLKCNKRAIVEPLAIILSPYAPHVAEELWSLLGHKETITYASFPDWKEEFIKDDSFEYPVSVNGKTRFKITLPLSKTKDEIEKEVVSLEELKKYLNGNQPKKVIVVHGRIVNVVC